MCGYLIFLILFLFPCFSSKQKAVAEVMKHSQLWETALTARQKGIVLSQTGITMEGNMFNLELLYEKGFQDVL